MCSQLGDWRRVLLGPGVERGAHAFVEPDARPGTPALLKGAAPVAADARAHERRAHGRRRPAAAVRAVHQDGPAPPRRRAKGRGALEILQMRRRAVPAPHQQVVVAQVQAPLRQLYREVQNARPPLRRPGRRSGRPATSPVRPRSPCRRGRRACARTCTATSGGESPPTAARGTTAPCP